MWNLNCLTLPWVGCSDAIFAYQNWGRVDSNKRHQGGETGGEAKREYNALGGGVVGHAGNRFIAELIAESIAAQTRNPNEAKPPAVLESRGGVSL